VSARPHQIGEVADLPALAVDVEPDRALVQMADIGGAVDSPIGADCANDLP